MHIIAALLGTHPTTISHATSRTTALLAHARPSGRHPAAAPPPANPPRTLDDLREYAARHGITIPAGAPAARTPPADSTVQAPGTPQTHLNLERLPSRMNAASTPFDLGRAVPE